MITIVTTTNTEHGAEKDEVVVTCEECGVGNTFEVYKITSMRDGSNAHRLCCSCKKRLPPFELLMKNDMTKKKYHKGGSTCII